MRREFEDKEKPRFLDRYPYLAAFTDWRLMYQDGDEWERRVGETVHRVNAAIARHTSDDVLQLVLATGIIVGSTVDIFPPDTDIHERLAMTGALVSLGYEVGDHRIVTLFWNDITRSTEQAFGMGSRAHWNFSSEIAIGGLTDAGILLRWLHSKRMRVDVATLSSYLAATTTWYGKGKARLGSKAYVEAHTRGTRAGVIFNGSLPILPDRYPLIALYLAPEMYRDHASWTTALDRTRQEHAKSLERAIGSDAWQMVWTTSVGLAEGLEIVNRRAHPRWATEVLRDVLLMGSELEYVHDISQVGESLIGHLQAGGILVGATLEGSSREAHTEAAVLGLLKAGAMLRPFTAAQRANASSAFSDFIDTLDLSGI